MEVIRFRNIRNSNKYLEIGHTKCYHYYMKQFIKTANNGRNYTGYTLKKAHKGVWQRTTWRFLGELLKDYEIVDCVR